MAANDVDVVAPNGEQQKQQQQQRSSSNKKRLSTAASSTNLATQFNNPSYSDCQIMFPRSSTKLFLHKVILCSNSDFFRACFDHDMIESKRGVVTMDDDDHEQLMTELLKSLYTQEMHLSDNEIICMILLAKVPVQCRATEPGGAHETEH